MPRRLPLKQLGFFSYRGKYEPDHCESFGGTQRYYVGKNDFRTNCSDKNNSASVCEVDKCPYLSDEEKGLAEQRRERLAQTSHPRNENRIDFMDMEFREGRWVHILEDTTVSDPDDRPIIPIQLCEEAYSRLEQELNLPGIYRKIEISDPRYPQRLKGLGDAPRVLYVAGNGFLRRKGINPNASLSIIGTRSPSYKGVEIAQLFGRLAAKNNFVVVSGYATGIDSAGHMGAMDEGGGSIAVLGSGINNRLPEKPALEDYILAYGAFVSELENPDAPREYEYLMARDRITAGLSDIVVVVETDAKGGAVHTARLAKEQGKQIWVVEWWSSPKYEKIARFDGNRILVDEGIATPVPILDVGDRFKSDIKSRLSEFRTLIEKVGFGVDLTKFLEKRIGIYSAPWGDWTWLRNQIAKLGYKNVANYDFLEPPKTANDDLSIILFNEHFASGDNPLQEVDERSKRQISKIREIKEKNPSTSLAFIFYPGEAEPPPSELVQQIEQTEMEIDQRIQNEFSGVLHLYNYDPDQLQQDLARLLKEVF